MTFPEDTSTVDPIETFLNIEHYRVTDPTVTIPGTVHGSPPPLSTVRQGLQTASVTAEAALMGSEEASVLELGIESKHNQAFK